MLNHFFQIHPGSKIHAEQAESVAGGLEQKKKKKSPITYCAAHRLG